MCVATILPVFMFSSISATTPACELANPPSAIPRPVRTVPVCGVEFATLGCQFAELRDLARARSSTASLPGRRSAAAVLMFCSRNWYGSIFAR